MSRVHRQIPPLPCSAADRYISQLKCENPSIRSISLAGSDITVENVTSFSSALVDNSSVTYLSLVCLQGGGTSKGSTLLAASAMSLKTLRTLTWSNVCDDRSYAVKILSRGLALSKTLNRVLLMNSKFDNVDIECIARGLSKNASIHTMGLEACGVTDLGALVLSKMLRCNRALRTLSLDENVITDIGASALLSSIFDTTSLSSIWESNHTITSFSRSGSYLQDEFGMNKFYHVSPIMKRLISEVLEINQSQNAPAEAGRQKIALHMERRFNYKWAQELPCKVMPEVLCFCGATARFEFLRNMPELFASRNRTKPQGQRQGTVNLKVENRLHKVQQCKTLATTDVLRSSFKQMQGEGMSKAASKKSHAPQKNVQFDVRQLVKKKIANRKKMSVQVCPLDDVIT